MAHLLRYMEISGIINFPDNFHTILFCQSVTGKAYEYNCEPVAILIANRQFQVGQISTELLGDI